MHPTRSPEASNRSISRPARRRLGMTALVLTAGLTLAACMNTDQQTAYDLVNGSRADASLPALAVDNTAQTKAQAWADHLASTNTLAHSTLTAGMDDQWARLAENVGYGASIEQIHHAFLSSAGHRANILDPGLTHVGVGVAHGHGRTFVVLVFSQR